MRILLGFILGLYSFATLAQTYSFGVVPQQSSFRMVQLWTPVFDYLSEMTGYKLVFKTTDSIKTFEKHLASEDYDLAYMNPYQYTQFSSKANYKAFAKRRNQMLKSIIVAHKDSPFNTLADLQGKLLAFPSPVAFGASIIPRAELDAHKIYYSANFLGSHDAVYLSLSQHLYAAGGGVPRTLNTMNKQVKDKLKILWTSDSFTPHAFAAHSRVPAKVIDALQFAIKNMTKDPRGKYLLARIKIKHGIESAADEDWDDVRALDIKMPTDLHLP